jgi:hypothetical protein
MKNFNNTIGNRTRDLPTYSAVTQPTAPSRAPSLREYLRKFMIPSHFAFLRMRNISDEVCRHNHTHILYSVTLSENRAVYEVIWQNMVEPDRPLMTVEYGAFALNAGYLRLQTHTHTHTHSEYVILIAFPRQ